LLLEAELVAGGRNRAQVNRQPLRRARDLLGALRVTVFSPDDLAYIHDHYIVTDHSQLITASAGLSYLFWKRTRVSLDLIVGSGLRRTVRNPNDSSNPPYQQLDLGISHRFELPAFGKMEARFDVINLLGQDYVLRNGTGVGIFATQFGPPRGFFGGLKKEF